MKVPFELRKLSAPQPADALLVVADDSTTLLALCVRLARWPEVYRVAGGYLLKLAGPTPSACPGAIRLRCLVDNLFVPTDAALVPALLADEARGLALKRGLVFLPGNRILAFAPDQPLPLGQFLDVPEPRRPAWKSLPELPERPECIVSIRLDLPEDTPDAVLQPGNEDIGTETPRPSAANLPAHMAGKAALGMGKFLVGLGQMLGMKGLAGLGASWMKKGLEMAPRLGESLFGRQEEALRELLRQFKAGNLEAALRRALPLGSDGDRGGIPYTGGELPHHNLAYSLMNILGGGGGSGPIWYGGADLQVELRREYRKAAELAIQRGDFRRAAFIHGKLLRDYRRAAAVLMQGCLFRDAAILYLTKLDDRRSAARAFEAAGDIDRAVELYRQMGEHVEAGDALRRAGDEEQAVREYQHAAQLKAQRGDYLGAGDLMLSHVHRPDLAREYFRLGWQQRPQGTAVPCAMSLARMHTGEAASAALRQLVREAREYFARPGDDAGAGDFFNLIADLADRPRLADSRTELRDHALLGLGVKLRQRAALESRPGNLVAGLFGKSGAWSAGTVGDAEFAVAAAFRKPHGPRVPRVSVRVPLGTGTITAVVHAPSTGDIVAGFDSGEVVCYRSASGRIDRVQEPDGRRVISLATSSQGQTVCVLQDGPELRLRAHTSIPSSDFFQVLLHTEEEFPPGDAWLTPLIAGNQLAFGIWMEGEHSDDLHIRQIVTNRRERLGIDLYFAHALLLPSWFRQEDCMGFLIGKHSSSLRPTLDLLTENAEYSIHLGPLRSFSSTSSLSWLLTGPDLELAGLNVDGDILWTRLHHFEQRVEVVVQASAADPKGYEAVAIVRPSYLAGVTKRGIHWLRAGATVTVQATTELPLPNAIACFPGLFQNELLVICADGALERVPVPI